MKNSQEKSTPLKICYRSKTDTNIQKKHFFEELKREKKKKSSQKMSIDLKRSRTEKKKYVHCC